MQTNITWTLESPVFGFDFIIVNIGDAPIIPFNEILGHAYLSVAIILYYLLMYTSIDNCKIFQVFCKKISPPGENPGGESTCYYIISFSLAPDR